MRRTARTRYPLDVIALLALFEFSATCGAQVPQITDPRVVIDRLHPEYRQFNAVGMVFPLAAGDGNMMISKYRSSGAMISRCHVLTNYHIAFEGSRNEVAFEAGQTPKKIASFQYTALGQIVDAGSLWADRDTVDDWALVRLVNPKTGKSDNLGEKIGYMEFAAAAPAVLGDKDLIASGYPGEQSGLAAHIGCRFARVDRDRRWRMACSITEGQYGGPVTLQTADKGDVIVAINSAKPDGASGIVSANEARLSILNYATPLTRSSETRIRRSMESHKCD